MIDQIGRRLSDRAIDSVSVEDVNGVPDARCVLWLVMAASMRPGDQARVRRGQKVEEVAAGKARGPRHQYGLWHWRLRARGKKAPGESVLEAFGEFSVFSQAVQRFTTMVWTPPGSDAA